MIGQLEWSGDNEGRLTYLWLVVIVFMFTLPALQWVLFARQIGAKTCKTTQTPAAMADLRRRFSA